MSRNTTRRKLAIASWSAPREGNIYGKMTIDATESIRYIDHLRETTGEKVTITHLVGKVVAEALVKAPDLNGRILFGKFIPHKTVDVTYLVTLEGGSDLAKAKIDNTDKKSTAEISRELREKAERLRRGGDKDFEKSKGMLKALPTWLLRWLVFLTGWLTSALGIGIKALGLEPYPFGSCIITSVGMLGLDEGFAPPTPWARVPLYVAVPAIKDTPVVVDGQVVVKPTITLTATIDHRFIDGFQAAVLAKTARDLLEDPWKLDKAD